MATLLIISTCTILSALLYRLGGAAQIGSWTDALRHTKARDLGCPLMAYLAMWVMGVTVPWWAHVATYLLTFAALTTYWDSVFGYDNHYAHGGGVALAALPYALATGGWLGFGLRVVAVTAFMGLWSDYVEHDITEELGRGAIMVATTPLLLL
jgi:hypothetical protein